MRGEEAVGYVTSGGYGHRIDRSIALGYVPTELARDGETFTLDIFGTERRATISLSAPYDRQGSRLRS